MLTAETERAITLILKDASERRSAAGFSGRTDDGGAEMLETQVRFYRMGADHVFPPEWREYMEQAMKENDPEYQEYQRLKRKFQ